MKDFVSNYGDWLYRAIVLAALVATLWLNSKYTPRDMTEKMTEEMRANNERVLSRIYEIDSTLKVMAAQAETLRDHEVRIRALERGS